LISQSTCSVVIPGGDAMQSIVMSMFVCLRVCDACFENDNGQTLPNFCACWLWPWL